MEKNEMPVGFAMALAMDLDAMKNFSMCSEEKKQQIIEGTHSIKSKDEMHQYVRELGAGLKTDTRA